MTLDHARVERSGVEVHFWGSTAGLAAIHVGPVPPVAVIEGSRPVPGVTIGTLSPALQELARAVDRFLDGAPLDWNGEIDLRGVPDFSWRVYEATRRVRWGVTSTYREIARAIGQPRSVRAVGNALHRNPFPLVIPCHRVIQEGGRIGGYSAGTAMKRHLLDLEAGQRGLDFPEGST